MAIGSPQDGIDDFSGWVRNPHLPRKGNIRLAKSRPCSQGLDGLGGKLNKRSIGKVCLLFYIRFSEPILSNINERS